MRMGRSVDPRLESRSRLSFAIDIGLQDPSVEQWAEAAQVPPLCSEAIGAQRHHTRATVRGSGASP